MSTRRVQSLRCKSKEKKKRKKRGNIQRKEKGKKKLKMKKINVEKLIHSTKMSNFSLQLSLHFAEKTPGSSHLFSFLSTQPNTLQKVFISIFFPNFFIHLISPPRKHIGNSGPMTKY